MKTSEALRIWIGDLKPDKEVKAWMERLDRLDRLEEDLHQIEDENEVLREHILIMELRKEIILEDGEEFELG